MDDFQTGSFGAVIDKGSLFYYKINFLLALIKW